MIVRRVLRSIIELLKLYGLLGRYIYLHIVYVYLHIKYYFLKAAGAALVEAVKIECCIKSLSKENRVIFAACVAISIYLLAFIVFFRI